MPKWWPWGRSKHSDPEPAAPVSRPEPAWHRLPVIQRTVGAIEPTAHLQGFTESLTTSQNPGLTGPLDLLSAEHSDRLGMLELRDPVRATVQPDDAPAVSTPQSQTWAPSPFAVQRALRQSSPTVQRAADVATPVREIQPVGAVSSTDTVMHSMVDAPQLDAPRPLDVAAQPDVTVREPQPPEPVASPPDFSVEPVEAETVSGSPSTEPESPAGHDARTVEAPPTAHSVHSTSSDTTNSSVTPPLRHLPSVQRAASESVSAPVPFADARPIPVLRTIDSPAGSPPSTSDAVTTCAGNSRTTLQRSTEPAAARPIGTDAAVLPIVDVGKSPTPPSPVSAQRITTTTTSVPEPAPRTKRNPAPEPGASSLPAAEVQRLPVVEAESAATARSAVPQHHAPGPPTVQRSPELSTETATHIRVPTDDKPSVAEASAYVPLDGLTEPVRKLQPAPGAVPPEQAAPPRTNTGVVQRIGLPVVERTPAPLRTQSPSTPRQSELSVSSVVPRAATGRRLVVLPPVRRTSASEDAPSDPSSAPTRSVLFDGPGPVGLQRMFEHTTTREDRTTAARPADSVSFGSGDSFAGYSDSGLGHSETSEHAYDATTNTITFSSPTLQREPEAAAPPPQEPTPQAVPASTVTSAPAAASPAPGVNVDDLVNRLYDPLAARLRAELWLDRERAGVLMDLGR